MMILTRIILHIIKFEVATNSLVNYIFKIIYMYSQNDCLISLILIILYRIHI